MSMFRLKPQFSLHSPSANTKAVTFICLLSVLTQFATAQNQKRRVVTLTLQMDAENGLVEPGELVKITANLRNLTGTELITTITWRVHSLVLLPPQDVVSTLRLGAQQTISFDFTTSLPQAGFADIECTVEMSGTDQIVKRRVRFGCKPSAVKAILTKEPDFDSFWKTAIAELNAIPPEFKISEHSERKNNRVQVFEVTMRSHGQTRVRGWLHVPRYGKTPFPAVIRVPGYGQSMKPIAAPEDMIVFAFNPRGHGNSQQDIPGKPVNYWVRGLDDKNDYFYKGAYLDCLRAVDFVSSRPDVDSTKIAIWGASQGGGLAFATSALDPRIDHCVADIPFLCDWVDYFRLTDWPEMNDWIAEREPRSWESTLRTLSYFDTMNLADRIRCPTTMGIGLQDQICPPTTCFAAFNRIPAKKRLKIYEHKGHGLGAEHDVWVWGKLREAFKRPLVSIE